MEVIRADSADEAGAAKLRKHRIRVPDGFVHMTVGIVHKSDVHPVHAEPRAACLKALTDARGAEIPRPFVCLRYGETSVVATVRPL